MESSKYNKWLHWNWWNPQQSGLGNTTSTNQNLGILSYDQGYYVDPNSGVQYRAGFDRKQNIYYAAIKNDSLSVAEEVITPGNKSSGLKGQYLVVTFAEDDFTDRTGAKQLFSVGAVYNNR